jgi:ABC-type ATPase with predicted acetyltransferase domain
VLVCGASGAGKSSLLRRAMSMESRTWIDPSTLTLRGRCVVDCFEHDDLAETLELLSRFGLAEVWTYLRAPEALSEGQRWRLRLAMALERSRLDQDRSAPTLVCDEFCAALDRITAAVVSRALRKAIDGRSPVGALLATSHEDLASALRPDRIYRCDFGEIRRER